MNRTEGYYAARNVISSAFQLLPPFLTSKYSARRFVSKRLRDMYDGTNIIYISVIGITATKDV
jgi:hypothetical protein